MLNSNLGNEPVLLWTNPSPTSVFYEQSISLDLSKYKAIIIESYYTDYSQSVCTRGLIYKNESLWIGASGYARIINVKADSVEISSTYYGGTTGHNEVILPYKIYGVK